MNLRDLSYLLAVADHRHFSRAAAAAHVSQPTLSGQIAKLEAELGVALFERDSRNVALTPAGAAIAVEARAALAHAEAIREIARAHRDPLAGPFRLGVIASLGPFLAPDLLPAIEHDAPRMTIELTEDLTDALLDALRGHRIDAALVATAPDGDDLATIVLFDEPFLVAHAPGHPLAARKRLTTDAIGGETLLLLAEGHCLRDQALALCGTAAVDPRLKAASLLTLMGLVAAGHGATLVPKLAASWAEGLSLREIAGADAHRRIRLVARRHYPRMAALDVVAGAARAVARARGLQPIG
ncbi:MAG: LysR substrate-binding domain-containing protein [Alphaproteobacteria bacterium]